MYVEQRFKEFKQQQQHYREAYGSRHGSSNSRSVNDSRNYYNDDSNSNRRRLAV